MKINKFNERFENIKSSICGEMKLLVEMIKVLDTDEIVDLKMLVDSALPQLTGLQLLWDDVKNYIEKLNENENENENEIKKELPIEETEKSTIDPYTYVGEPHTYYGTYWVNFYTKDGDLIGVTQRTEPICAETPQAARKILKNTMDVFYADIADEVQKGESEFSYDDIHSIQPGRQLEVIDAYFKREHLLRKHLIPQHDDKIVGD